jgi:hypothetical protein
LERKPFHSIHSLAEIVGVSDWIVIRHLRDSLGMKTSICAGCHTSWLRICVVADLKFAGDYCQSWKRESSIHFQC